jgi:hypothetical protein
MPLLAFHEHCLQYYLSSFEIFLTHIDNLTSRRKKFLREKYCWDPNPKDFAGSEFKLKYGSGPDIVFFKGL